MRTTVMILMLAGVPAVVWAAPSADAITGIWLNSEKSGYIQIYQTESGTYAGQVVGATDGHVRDDIKNPDPDERDESLLGQKVLWGFTYNGNNGWEEGHVYDPDKGETYDAWLALKDRDKLKVHGYIFFSIIGRTEIWTRVVGMPDNVVERVLVPTPAKPGPSGKPD